MKRIISAVAVIGFAFASSAALADQAKPAQAKPQPIQMTDAQLDAVAAGQIEIGSGLVDIGPVDIDVRALNNSLNDVRVFVPVDVAANINAVVGVLGNAAGFARQLGRQ